MITSDDVSETEGNRTAVKKSVCKEQKSSFQLCEDWSISNVDVGYTDTDFMNLTNYKLFGQHIRPVIAAKHPKLPMAKVMALIAAKWREFCEVKEKREKRKEMKENAVENAEESDRDETEVTGRTRQRRTTTVKKNTDEIHPDDIDDDEEDDGDAKKRTKRVAPLKIKLSNNNSGSESGLRRTKRVKKRRRHDEDSFNDSDAEFEAMLEEGRSADEEAARKKRTKRPRTTKSIPQRLNRPVTDGYETDHQDYCEACGQGGEILLCDTCPRAFHLVCVDPEAENPPEGDWSCPICIKDGFTKKEDEDHHMEYCRVCRDGGELLCCDRCPNSYHMHCIIPRVLTVPEGDWFCPRCMVVAPKVPVKKVLSWRWRIIKGTNSTDASQPVDSEYPFKLEPTVVDPVTKEVKIRELFVKYDGLSYWHCEWIPELVLEVHQSILWRCYWKKVTDHDNPPKVEIDADEEESGRWNPCLERKFYRYGVRPEWLTVHRIINHKKERTGEVYFLVKWRDLGYDMATYEPEEGEFSKEIVDWSKHISDYWKLRARADGEVSRHGSGKSLKRKYDDDEEEPLGDPRKKYEKQPEYIDKVGGTLHEYQLEGLNWLRFSWCQGTDVILADEMGLGKTVQTISFLYSLYKENLCNGPFLISAPLSTIINWDREFEFWAPDMYVVTYTGDRESRSVIRKHEFCHEEDAIRSGPKACKVKMGSHVKFHVLLTSYELICVDSACLSSVDWEILVVDEAHRLKNNQSKFFRTLSEFSIKRKVLLTGTPLQNNLEELYHLLNFLSPANFNDMSGFLQEFSDISKDNQVKKLHEMLGPHLLRRLKADVLKNMPTKSEFIVRIEPSPMQKKYYQYIIHKNYDVLSTKSGGGQTSLLNVVMELKKCCNHPYLLVAAAAEAPLTKNGQYEGNALIKACGKLELLSKMLPKLKASGHRVLIFSQMTKMMDIMEDFLDFMGYKYERIDGKITGPERQDAIDRFNAAGAEQFVFILSTRSGGLGINLATADTVIIYDSDWNPHNDIQAFSRAHRIGQQNKVMIYRFVTRETVEERICQVAKRKMMLTHLIVRPGVGRGQNMSKKELEDILRFGTENLFKPDTEKDEDDKCLIHYDDEAIDRLLDRSQQGIEEKECGLNEYLSSFKVASYLIKDDAEEEVVEKEEESDGYWERLLGDQHTQLMEDEARNWGKGKRSRRQVNYAVPANDESWTDQVSECNSELSPSAGNDGEDEDADFDERNESRRKRGGKEKMLPPLIFKMNGNTEILGFNARQRKAFLNAVMRFGLPPNDVYSSQWLVRDLRQKSEKEFRAYVSLFMRHLCESSTDGAETFLDGVPREGLSRQQVLSRIGVMSLVRKKVHEYEAANGLWSIPEMAPSENPVLCQGFIKQEMTDENSSGCNDPLAPNATAADLSCKPEAESMDVDEPVPEAKPDVKPVEVVEAKSTPQNSIPSAKSPLKVKFNIADGGFTDLHGLWNGEEKVLNSQNEREIWHRSHDYWLLAGVVTHGYGRWQDIQSDPRFALINEPFLRESGKGNFLEMKNKFLARRYKLLEQALVVEEQLRRAVFLNILSQSNNPAINLLQRHSDLECIAECHQHLSKENLSENRSANVVLHKVLSQLEELLMEMKSEVNKLPSTLARLAPVTDRLQMSEKSILSSLNIPTQAQSSDSANGAPVLQPNPYLSYPYYVGPFAYPPLPNQSFPNKQPHAPTPAAAQSSCGSDIQEDNSVKTSNKNGRDIVIID